MQIDPRFASFVPSSRGIEESSVALKGTKEREKLKEACQQFESILLAEIWKKMNANARSIGGKSDSDRPFGPMEDLAVEMSAEQLAKEGGAGMWRMLYDQLVVHLDSAEELARRRRPEEASE
jgi:Rod binding domain-containing protein